MLPERSSKAEDGFVRTWTVSEDTDGLIEAIQAAMDAKRPQLAARLVGLLSEHIDIPEGSALARAQAAAKLLLFDNTTRDAAFDDFVSAWRAARRSKMKRVKRRMREAVHGNTRRRSRTGRTRDR